MELFVLFVAVLVFILLWWLIDLLATLLATLLSRLQPPPPAFPFALVGHILLIIAAIVWLWERYLGGRLL